MEPLPQKRSWPLSTLLTIADHSNPSAFGNDPIHGVTADSRQVKTGDLFVAIQGAKADGLSFAAQAIQAGAAAILAQDFAHLDPTLQGQVPCITHPFPSQALARMAAFFSPGQPSFMAAVTGTNGKTSTAEFARQLWQLQGLPAASLGTLGVIAPVAVPPAPSLTTADPVSLHSILAALAQQGVQHAVMEAASHGLVQHRLDGVTLHAAAFTNLTQDHLDYHGTMAAYYAAKARLFAVLLPRGACAVINIDSPHGQDLARLCQTRGHRLITFGQAAAADLRFDEWRATTLGQSAHLHHSGQSYPITLPLIGQFQLYNLLGALGLVIGSGCSLESLLPHLDKLAGIAGRAELVGHHPNGAGVVVDYAHTPDGLENILSSVRQHTAGSGSRLHVVFGCGGNRDSTKRPMMGAIAQRLADVVYVTDDNPRFEDPALIRSAILSACPNGHEIGDRAQAIAQAIGQLSPGDNLVIAGKGQAQ
ncbi:MAG: UDP-N-acetylmuramoyl-L-alanyl-D-glutamate--2,6-diaminopimelate ligase, partial [Alphaproteobacteria bacterium]|nr:UDP-N-acetylmuramoyl-L-alanyl-D-glutamate--2,6-diaminopimelate ligase [Alphaproteobacteria bacterium]